jgi:hypothetical protein
LIRGLQKLIKHDENLTEVVVNAEQIVKDILTATTRGDFATVTLTNKSMELRLSYGAPDDGEKNLIKFNYLADCIRHGKWL